VTTFFYFAGELQEFLLLAFPTFFHFESFSSLFLEKFTVFIVCQSQQFALFLEVFEIVGALTRKEAASQVRRKCQSQR